MGAGLFRDQDGHLILNAIFFCGHICHRVRADGELTEGERLMIFQDIVVNIPASLLFIPKISAPVIRDHSVLKGQFQIVVFQSVQINPAHMQHSGSPFQHR